jgi:glycosyltransferase involved in cell wall biosynthesis
VNRSSHHILSQKELLEELAQSWSWEERIPSKESIEREIEEYELADKIIVPSVAAYNSFKDHMVNMEKVVINPFPLSPTSEPVMTRRRKDVLFVGNVTLQKGFHTLVSAFESLKIPGLKLHVVGIYSRDFISMLRRRGFELNNIIFHGPLNSGALIEMYETTEMLVLPSIHDGWGMVVNEAMVLGCIPIVSSGAGAADQIEQGINGFVFTAGDTDGLKNCILKTLGNEELRTMMMKSIENSERFQRSWDDFSKVYLDES